MEDKEKQAIEKIYNGKKMDLISIIRTFKREGIENFVVTKKETVETVLNLIEKQQAEMFKLQAKADRLKVARDNWKKTFYQAEEEIEKYKYLYQKALNNTIKSDRENLEKDKLINEMVKIFINSDYCFEITDHLKCNECINKNKEKRCKDCIKEYFKKKVEDK